jgi:hypothetical protein
MKLAFVSCGGVARNLITTFGGVVFAVACSAQSGEVAGSSSSAIRAYACVPTGECWASEVANADAGETQPECTANSGCSWIDSTCTSQCSGISSSTACVGYPGWGPPMCQWEDGSCEPVTACPRGRWATEAACIGAGCDWSPSYCTQTTPCPTGDSVTGDECNANAQCQWTFVLRAGH